MPGVDFKKEIEMQTVKLGQFVVNFQHSSDKSSSIVFSSDNVRKCMNYLVSTRKYNESINQTMYSSFGEDGLINEIAYFNGDFSKFGFRYWIEDSKNVPTPKDLSFDALDYAEPIIFEYLACWIGNLPDMILLRDKLAMLGMYSHRLDGNDYGASVKYTFTANESEMLQWRECLVGHNLDPFYVHNIRQIA